MEELLEIQIEFSESAAQGEITTEAITSALRDAFLEIGVDPTAVQAGVEKIDLRKESQLGVDPGVAALVIATIGVGMDLIKIAVDLYKQRRAHQADSQKHHQDVELELAKLQLERDKFEFEKQKLEAQRATESNDSPVNQERIRDLLDTVLIAKLIEKHHIQDAEYRFDLVQRP